MEVRSASSVWSLTACPSLHLTLHGNQTDTDDDDDDGHVQVHPGDATGPEPAQGQPHAVLRGPGGDECQ